MSPTRIVLSADRNGGLPRLELFSPRSSGGGGALRARLLDVGTAGAQVALVQDGALLLRGDEVEIEVVVGPGMRLELVEPSGTVAYAMRGGSASWRVDVAVESGGTLLWQGQPFVVAEGADVRRSTNVRLAETATLVQRETLVLGRTREAPGALVNSCRVRRGCTPVLAEDLRLGPGAATVGVLGPHRVVDTVLALLPIDAAGASATADVPTPPDVQAYDLAYGGRMWRGLAGAAHTVSLSAVWQALLTADSGGYGRVVGRSPTGQSATPTVSLVSASACLRASSGSVTQVR
ncbi:urease accessory protein UreD [Actinopolymorpha sp. NPDC004070]|uniref:urease accessory protein UreD n=1 Tax=Actinopolymorpha sp. NPDC004070 TaxID=3154548 RepID=UPI0033A3B232